MAGSVHWYYATDTHGGLRITDNKLNDHLRRLNSNITGHRLGKIPMVVGMPIMFCHNYDVEAGIVNGCIGNLKGVRYWVDEEGDRHATSCVVEVATLNGEALPHLEPNQCVAIEDCTDIQFVHPHSKEKLKIKRTQLPIMPAFAITTYKSQGLTLDKAMVDLQSCKGSQAPYVMVSRVRSLQDLVILRPFSKSVICKRMSEDLRHELARQTTLELITITSHGRSDQQNLAVAQLKRMGINDHVWNTFHLDTATEDDINSIISLNDQYASALHVNTTAGKRLTRKQLLSQHHTLPPKRIKRV